MPDFSEQFAHFVVDKNQESRDDTAADVAPEQLAAAREGHEALDLMHRYGRSDVPGVWYRQGYLDRPERVN